MMNRWISYLLLWSILIGLAVGIAVECYVDPAQRGIGLAAGLWAMWAVIAFTVY